MFLEVFEFAFDFFEETVAGGEDLFGGVLSLPGTLEFEPELFVEVEDVVHDAFAFDFEFCYRFAEGAGFGGEVVELAGYVGAVGPVG